MIEPMVKSVDKALNVHKCFKEQESYTLDELAKRTGLNKSTLYGLVQTLTLNNFLQQSPETGRYSLGLMLLELGSLYRQRLDIRDQAKQYCIDLSTRFGATVNLTSYDGDELCWCRILTLLTIYIFIFFIGFHSFS